jgi:hypothetical protein
VEASDLRLRLLRITDDLREAARSKDSVLSLNVRQVIDVLLDEARKAVPDDPVVKAATVTRDTKVSEAAAILGQVVLALPSPVPLIG